MDRLGPFRATLDYAVFSWPRSYDVRVAMSRGTPTKASGTRGKCRQVECDFRPTKKRNPLTQRLMGWERWRSTGEAGTPEDPKHIQILALSMLPMRVSFLKCS